MLARSTPYRGSGAAPRSPLWGPSRCPPAWLCLPFPGQRAGAWGKEQLRAASTGGRGLPWGVSPQPFVPSVYLRPAICMTKTLLVDASVAWRC